MKDMHQSTGEKKACQIMILCFDGPRGRFNLAIKFNEQLFFFMALAINEEQIFKKENGSPCLNESLLPSNFF